VADISCSFFGLFHTFTNQEFAMLSARNQVPGQVTAVKLGAVAAEVVISTGGVEIVAAITRDSAERMKLAAGDRVVAVIKASDVMISKD